MAVVFLRLIDPADASKGAVWKDTETGREQKFAAPRHLRPKCAGTLPNGKPCFCRSQANFPYCRQHLASHVSAPASAPACPV